MLSLIDIGWTAGFLEGEGHFAKQSVGNSIYVEVAQKQREPLERLQKMFGGSIYNTMKTSGADRWHANAQISAQLMMTIYSLMSPRRKKQIQRCLAVWKHQKKIGQRGRSKCLGLKVNQEN